MQQLDLHLDSPDSRIVVVTGGVLSGVGKGICAASLGLLLKARGLDVAIAKIDPYLNVDPGTMNPGEHGECYVTERGEEVDLDFGHYWRFAGTPVPPGASITSGAVYRDVITDERRGRYLGGTVQVVPHITSEFRDRVLRLTAGPGAPDVVIVEVGGTVGDIEGLPVLEAVRQLRQRLGRDRFCNVHVTWVPYLPASGEHKTKPTQHSVVELRARGITPDVIIARSHRTLPARSTEKIGHLCDVTPERVVCCPDASSIYDVPEVLQAAGYDRAVLETLGLDAGELQLDEWHAAGERRRVAVAAPQRPRIGVVGKYVSEPDAYLSVIEAVRHAGWSIGTHPEVVLVDAELVATSPEILGDLDAVVVPGGFGNRAFDGKLAAVRWCRENNVAFLGLCLGLQAAVVEAARNLARLDGANSAEFDEHTPHPVVDLMAAQRDVVDMGGTMRLGDYPAHLAVGSVVADLYGQTFVTERHRHRYEVNGAYRGILEHCGLIASGTSPDGRLVEFVERRDHRFFVATQAHPELISRPDQPHPLFVGLVTAACDLPTGGVGVSSDDESLQVDD